MKFVCFAVCTTSIEHSRRRVGRTSSELTHQRLETIRSDNYVRPLYLVGDAVNHNRTRCDNALFWYLSSNSMSDRSSHLDAYTGYDNSSYFINHTLEVSRFALDYGILVNFRCTLGMTIVNVLYDNNKYNDNR